MKYILWPVLIVLVWIAGFVCGYKAATPRTFNLNNIPMSDWGNGDI